MKLIAHRGLWEHQTEANSLSALRAALEAGIGLETDIRAFGNKLYLSHDVITDPRQLPLFESLLDLALTYPLQPLFLNIKEDGLIEFLSQYKAQLSGLNAVFFDMSVPELVRYTREFPPSMLAARISDVEPYPCGIEHCEWIWVDGFYRNLTINEIKPLYLNANHRCVFVSPELHGREARSLWHLIEQAPWLSQERTFLCTDLAHKFFDRNEECS